MRPSAESSFLVPPLSYHHLLGRRLSSPRWCARTFSFVSLSPPILAGAAGASAAASDVAAAATAAAAVTATSRGSAFITWHNSISMWARRHCDTVDTRFNTSATATTALVRAS